MLTVMKPSDFRRLALALPNTEEGSHFGNADFRVNGRIFATLSLEREGYGVLLLAPEQQAGMVQDAPEILHRFPAVGASMGRRASCSPKFRPTS